MGEHEENMHKSWNADNFIPLQISAIGQFKNEENVYLDLKLWPLSGAKKHYTLQLIK